MRRGALWAMGFMLAPQAVNTFATSFPLERLHAFDLETLHRLHEARPCLDAVSVVAALWLLASRKSGSAGHAALLGGVGGALFLRTLALFITAQPAHPAYHGSLRLLGVAALDARLSPEAPVIGVFVNGEARCYPLALLLKPAVVSDTLGGVPIAPTFCPMSRTALAIQDDWRGVRLCMQAVGAPNNDLALYASGPRGIISQLRARLMTGPHAGEVLRTYPAHLTTWARWRSLHPTTTGAWWETGWQGAYLDWLLSATMARDAASDEPLYATRSIDRRLPIKSPVLGVRVGDDARAFTRIQLRAQRVREVAVGGEPLVVFYDPGRDLASCFSRRLGGRMLHFEAHGEGLMRDRETGRLWNVAGVATDGDRLEPADLVADGVYWFAWAYAHPQTPLSMDLTGVKAP